MLANNIWELLSKFFENVLFLPYDLLRKETSGWWISNLMTWFLVLLGFSALIYWMKQMYKFKKEGKEDEA
jgi:ATP-dependent Zn protease